MTRADTRWPPADRGPIIGLIGLASRAPPSPGFSGESTSSRVTGRRAPPNPLTPSRISCTLDPVDDDPLLQGPNAPNEIGRANENARGDGHHPFSLKRFTAKFHRRGVILERRLDEPIRDITPRCSVEFGPLRQSDIEEFSGFQPDRRREHIELRMSTGDLCFAARHGGALASTTWACRSKHWVPDLHFMWQVAPREVYLYDSYTDPRFRGRGIATALDAHVLRYFLGLDVDRALTAIAPENTASIRSKTKVGFRPCGDLRCLSIGWGVHLHRRRTFASASKVAGLR